MTAEQQLLAAMQARPGATLSELGRAIQLNRSTVEGRLRRLASHGRVEPAHGHWRLREAPEPRPNVEEPDPDP
jgi:DNA-binding IclR family transcriptional regulator